MSLQAEYPVKSICGVLDLARSSFYNRGKSVDEDDLRAALLEFAGQCIRPTVIAASAPSAKACSCTGEIMQVAVIRWRIRNVEAVALWS